jgi:hypothetical protein
MPQFNITASSQKANATVSNTDPIRFPSPAEFDSQANATVQAAKYAKSLNYEDYMRVWDWAGNASPTT